MKKLNSDFLTVKEVAKMLDMPVQTVYSWIHDCKIPAEKFGNQYVICKSDLVEMGLVGKAYIEIATDRIKKMKRGEIING